MANRTMLISGCGHTPSTSTNSAEISTTIPPALYCQFEGASRPGANLKLPDEASALEKNVNGDKSGVAFYSDAGLAAPKVWAMVQWLDEEENVIKADNTVDEAKTASYTYHMNLDNVTMLIEDSNISRPLRCMIQQALWLTTICMIRVAMM